MQTLSVGKNDAGQRLDKFLVKTLPNLPKSMMYKYIRLKKIKHNRKRAEISDILEEGDTVELFIKEEFLAREKSAHLFRNIRPCFAVAYEDANILICNKPVGLLCHSDEAGQQNTLVEQIKAYLWQKGEYDPEKEHSFAPALANRIDRNTCGLVIAAKTAEALRELNDQIRERDIKKQYLCRVHGTPTPREGVLSGWLIKNEADNIVRVYKKKPSEKLGDAKKIETGYRVLSERDGESLLEIDLLTGRTHQIRAHLAGIGHPLVGDGKYADNKDDRERGVYRQALCSYRVTFTKKQGPLGYLAGKTVAIPPEEIPFCEGMNLPKK
ncbi:MAG: RluA family pseudouridine synthase [Ruminococcus sp.]|nr:RluA family pseudouridine synthase [Candidatus Apopatosoma intestinale]